MVDLIACKLISLEVRRSLTSPLSSKASCSVQMVKCFELATNP